MSQSKSRSIQEACLQTGIGFGLSFLLQIILSHFYNMQVTFMDNVQITLWFTLLSLVRGYIVRRWMAQGDDDTPDAPIGNIGDRVSGNSVL